MSLCLSWRRWLNKMEKLKNKIKKLENNLHATSMTFLFPIHVTLASYVLSKDPKIDMKFIELMRKGIIYMAKTPISEIYGEFLKYYKNKYLTNISIKS